MCVIFDVPDERNHFNCIACTKRLSQGMNILFYIVSKTRLFVIKCILYSFICDIYRSTFTDRVKGNEIILNT